MGYMSTMANRRARKSKQGSKKPSAPLRAGPQSQMGQFRVHNRALLMAVVAQATNTTFPFAAKAVSLSKDGFSKNSLGWLANLMTLYDMFKIESVELEWVPSASSFTSGSMAMYYDPTPNAAAPKSFAAVSGNAGVVTTQVSKPVRYRVPGTALKGRVPWYLVDSEDVSACTQGTIVVCQSPGSIPSATGSVMLGSVWISYTMVLKNPTYLSAGPDVREDEPVLINQLILDEAKKLNEKMDRQVFAQEDTAESCQIIASKPALPPSIGNDIGSMTDDMATLSADMRSVRDRLNALDLSGINRYVDVMANPGNAPVVFQREGWHRLRVDN